MNEYAAIIGLPSIIGETQSQVTSSINYRLKILRLWGFFLLNFWMLSEILLSSLRYGLWRRLPSITTVNLNSSANFPLLFNLRRDDE